MRSAMGFRTGLLAMVGCLAIAAGSGGCGADAPTATPPATGGSAGAAGGGGKAGSAAAGKAGAGGLAGAAGSAGSAGTGTGTGGGVIGAACVTANDCGKLATTPEGCAEAECTAGKCAYRTVDGDGDGRRTDNCKAASGGPVTVGDDCNDKDKDIFPGAWDGPADGAKPNRCNDGVDQDCSGKPDDGKAATGATCTCTPGDTVTCNEDEGGKPISFPAGTLLGVCKRGTALCGADGKLGPCIGAKGPSAEVCNGADDDCDGTPDNNLPGLQLWFYDGDGDFHAAKGFKPVPACQQPNIVPPECNCTAGAPCPCDPKKWQIGLNPDDCDDTKAAVYPGAVETCNAIDDNCNGSVDEGVPPSTDKCEVGVGPCKRAGTKTCENGKFDGCSVQAGEGGAETCNGIDDDCDGVVDNALFGGKQVANAACFECLPVGFPTTLTQSKGDPELGGSCYVSAKLLIDDVGSGPTVRRVRLAGVLEERQGDNTALQFGGSNNITAKRAIKRVLTQDATGSYGFGSNGFGGFQLPSLIELGQITDQSVHTFAVPLKAVTEDGASHDVEPMTLDVVGDIVGPDFPPTAGGPYVAASLKCVWVELEK